MDTDLIQWLLLFQEEDEESILLSSLFREGESTIFKTRDKGLYETYIKKHIIGNERKFKEYFRVSQEVYQEILAEIKADVTRNPYNRVMKPISAEEMLCVTLRFLATGQSYGILSYQFRISRGRISHIINEVLNSIIIHFLKIVIPDPTEETLKACASEFYNKWNFPNCVGAVDGKHIQVANGKSFSSVVLLAIIDANYRFIAIDVGTYGEQGDKDVFSKSDLGKKINNELFKFPEATSLPSCNIKLPYVVVGSESFRLRYNVMKPYTAEEALEDTSKFIYNYRHSKAQWVGEKAFNILGQTFKIFHSPISLKSEKINLVITVACILHNLMIMKDTTDLYDSFTCENISSPGYMIPLHKTRIRATRKALCIRDKFKQYFNLKKENLQ